MSKHLRRRYFVDRGVQGRLLALIFRYWAVSLSTAGGLTVLGWIFVTPGVSGFVGPNSFMATILPMVLVGLCASALVLPLILWDMVRVTHRFAGPLVRFKRHLREAADGGPLVPLKFRDGDDWPELAEAYNQLIERIENERRALPEVEAVCSAQETCCDAKQSASDAAVASLGESSVVASTAEGDEADLVPNACV